MELKRYTVGLSDEARKVQREAAKKLKVSLFQAATILLENANLNDPKLVEAAKRIKEANRQTKLERKSIRDQLKGLTPEQLKKALESIDK